MRILFPSVRAGLQGVRPSGADGPPSPDTDSKKGGVIVAILLLGQHLTHDRRIVFLSDEPVSIPFQILKGMDRLAKLGLRKSLSLLAVADIFEDPVALDKKSCSWRSSRFRRSPRRLFTNGASHDILSRLRFPNRAYSHSPVASAAGKPVLFIASRLEP